MAADKSLFWAYALWLFGGWFGLHHFYLGRDRHGFVWFTSLGGICGLGWLRDFFKLPEYVKDANEDKEYMEELAEKMRKKPSPSVGFIRYFGLLTIGGWIGAIFRGAVPEELVNEGYPWKAIDILMPLAVAVGVWFVGGIGRQKLEFWWCLLGAYLPLHWSYNNPEYVSTSAFFSGCLATWKGSQWRRTPRKKRRLVKRVALFSLGVAVVLGMTGSMLWFNTYVTTKDGDRVPFREAAKNFLTSPVWQQTKQVCGQMWDYYQVHGIWKVWLEILDAFDPQGEQNAYKVLELAESATDEEITARYRKLARKWHPDRFRDEKERAEAQEKFMEIANAHDILSQAKVRRRQASSTRDDEPERDEF